MVQPNQEPLFDSPRGHGGRPTGSGRIPRDQFVSETIETIRHWRRRGKFPTRQDAADAHDMDVSTFDRYRAHYDVFRDWQATVHAVDLFDPPAVAEWADQVADRVTERVTEIFAPVLAITVERGTGTILSANEAATAALGYTHAELVGANVESMLRPGLPPSENGEPDLVAECARVRRGERESLGCEFSWRTRALQWLRVRGEMRYLPACDAFSLRVRVTELLGRPARSAMFGLTGRALVPLAAAYAFTQACPPHALGECAQHLARGIFGLPA